MKKQEIEKFEKIQAQIEGFHNEVSVLLKKKPHDGVNKFKIKLINQVIEQANIILTEGYRPFKDFEKFDLDELPTNSDTTFILAQYFNCMEKLRLDNIEESFDYNAHRPEWHWITEGKNKNIKTIPPHKLK